MANTMEKPAPQVPIQKLDPIGPAEQQRAAAVIDKLNSLLDKAPDLSLAEYNRLLAGAATNSGDQYACEYMRAHGVRSIPELIRHTIGLSDAAAELYQAIKDQEWDAADRAATNIACFIGDHLEEIRAEYSI